MKKILSKYGRPLWFQFINSSLNFIDFKFYWFHGLIISTLKELSLKF